MQVHNHTDFTMNNQTYKSFGQVEDFPLGTIVIDSHNCVGVVIQHLNEYGEVRTDMSGTVSIDDIRKATLVEVNKYRSKLVSCIKPSVFVVDTTKDKWVIIESYIQFDDYIKNLKPHKQGERERFDLEKLIFNINKFDKENFFKYVEDIKISELFNY